LVTETDFSFPSGHVTGTVALVGATLVVVTFTRTRARVAALALAVFVVTLVAGTRLYLGVHWLTDVVAGAIFGWTWFVLVTVLFGGRILRFGEPAERVAEHQVVPDSQDRQEVETPA
jgi:undecaprenyl-diphosphatase